MLNYIACLVLFVGTSFAVCAQESRTKVPSYFGLQFKPLIPGDFLGESTTTLQNGGFKAIYNQLFGYTFGAVTRIGLTELISFETGINQVQRNYRIDFSFADSSLASQMTFGMISYDIPLNGLIYIRLAEKLYMNASLGGAVVYNPSNVAKKIFPRGLNEFIHEGRRRSRVGFEINANIGFEWRTEKSGFFYLGASGRIPVQPIFDIAAAWGHQSASNQIFQVGEMNGTYLAFDVRYFFPNIKNKGKQPIKGPIE